MVDARIVKLGLVRILRKEISLPTRTTKSTIETQKRVPYVVPCLVHPTHLFLFQSYFVWDNEVHYYFWYDLHYGLHYVLHNNLSNDVKGQNIGNNESLIFLNSLLKCSHAELV